MAETKIESVARFLARENGAPHYGEDDWAVWVPQANSVIAMVADTVITDAMIDRGLACYSEGGCSGLAEHERREVVAAILDAALTQPGTAQ